MADPQEQRQINTGSIPSSDKSKDEKGKGMAQSSVPPVRPGTKDCQLYLETGRCDYRRTCPHNHPPHLRHELREKTDTPVCKFFPRGKCKKGSDCLFRHIMNRDGLEPMRQSTSHRATESRRQGVEASVFKRPRTPPMNRSVNAQENLQEQRQGNSMWQRRETQENLQEQRQRDNIERQRRETQENLQEQRHRDNIKRQRREAQENQQQQRLVMEIPENQNVEAHNQQNLEEQRKIEIDRQRTESRLRIDQMQPTVLFNESSRPREVIKEFGLKDFKGI